MVSALPLMLVPFALYNVAMFGLIGVNGANWLGTGLVTATMISGAEWTFTIGDLLIVTALAMLFVEILKAARGREFRPADHVLSGIVFLVFLAEFLLFESAATSVFFLLMLIALFDVAAAFAISWRSASRNTAIGLR